MDVDIEGQKPITIAQAWSAPILACVLGVAFAIWGMRVKPDAAWITATIIIMIVGPMTSTALAARGIVGLYRRHYWSGSIAVICGVLLFVAVASGLSLLQDDVTPPRGW